MLQKGLISLGLVLNAVYFSYAQDLEIPVNFDLSSRIETLLTGDQNFHSDIKPFITPYKIYDSVNHSGSDGKIFSYFINPIIISNFSINSGGTGSYTVGGGIWGDALISDKLSFHLLANVYHSKFPKYINEKIDSVGVVPHFGKYLAKYGNSYLYSLLSADLIWHPTSFIRLYAGYSKNFFGDGYRSLLLSDNSAPYPYFKIEFQAWKLKYVSLMAYLPDIDLYSGNNKFYSKYGVFHYLSFNATSWLNVNFFESIIWQGRDSSGTRGIEVNYLNPFLFLRPVEFSLGSPDNALLGIGYKLSPFQNFAFYGQFILDEFHLAEVKANRGWWGNKYGFQSGMKSFNFCGVKNLMILLEYNFARPYTFSYSNSLKNYGNQYQPLAHPLGANFKEAVVFGKYSLGRISISLKSIGAIYGADTSNFNFGMNIYKNYNIHKDIHNYSGQGLKTTQIITDAKISYLFKPQWNLCGYLGVRLLLRRTDLLSEQDPYLYVGFETSIFNSDVDY